MLLTAKATSLIFLTIRRTSMQLILNHYNKYSLSLSLFLSYMHIKGNQFFWVSGKKKKREIIYDILTHATSENISLRTFCNIKKMMKRDYIVTRIFFWRKKGAWWETPKITTSWPLAECEMTMSSNTPETYGGRTEALFVSLPESLLLFTLVKKKTVKKVRDHPLNSIAR